MEKFSEKERDLLITVLRTEGDEDLASKLENDEEIEDEDNIQRLAALSQHLFWFDDYEKEEDDVQIDEYDITATPNDFNIATIYSFIESGAVKIPGFQRNYVWDIKRASKLMESLILGLPVPQIFLYEKSRNEFLVIDGQQRLMSIYYFMKGRFPKKEKRSELRAIFADNDRIPDDTFKNGEYFVDFKLMLPSDLPDKVSKFHKMMYFNLGDYKGRFDLRPIRNVVIKQIKPTDDDSSIYEIFNRLNTGGTNLRPQEIRSSLHHSEFYKMLNELNMLPGWRSLLQMSGPDLHMKDIEILLRSFAMLIDGANYAPSLTKFLNQFSRKCEELRKDKNDYLQQLFESFLNACRELPDGAFSKGKGRFNIALFEAVFVASCESSFLDNSFIEGVLQYDKIHELDDDMEFHSASIEGTTGTTNVRKRLNRAREIIGVL